VYSAISSANIMELRRLLQTTARGGHNCNDYFEQMRHIDDQLAAIGEPIGDADLVRYILNELGSEFNSFVVALTTRSDVVSLEELHGFLLTHESLLLSQHQLSSTVDSMALFTSNRGQGQYSRGRGRSASYFPTPSPGRSGPFNPHFLGREQANSGQGNSFSSNFGRGRGLLPLPPYRDKPLCQVCKKRGHEALDCWYRFDNETYPSSPQAYFNTTSSTPNERWFLDSGASHHVTSDLNNLTSFHAYDGQDCLQVGNGSHLPIHNLGHCSLSSSNGSLDLNGVLHVPHITKNLISISKLTQDNNVILEFHPLFCIVKDRHTKQPLLRAQQTNGVYHLYSSPQDSIGERVSTTIWHKRLGHPSPSTTHFIINSNSLPITSNKLDLCGDCCKAKAHVLPFSSSLSIANFSLHVVHSDLWGPSPIVSMNGFRYYVYFVDEFSKFSWIYFLRTKDELVDVFTKFKSQIENLFCNNIKILQTDGGTEFKPLTHLFPQIIHQVSCPYTP
jgi:gag-polypeptide of LTR copia-type/GAG-pre-integrase domain